MDFVRFTRKYLGGVLRLCEAQGWPSLPEDPLRALRALSAPGVVTFVALEAGEVVGFAQLLTDGCIQAFLSVVCVAENCRGQGIGKSLIERAFTQSGAQRVDLLALDESREFYESFPHRTMAGYRIYPGTT